MTKTIDLERPGHGTAVSAGKALTLSELRVTHSQGLTTVSCETQLLGLIEFSYPSAYHTNVNTEVADAFVLPCLWAAMERGIDLCVNLPTSFQSEDALIEAAQICRAIDPRLSEINVSLKSNQCKSDEAAKERRIYMTGFSGGVDGLYTVAQRKSTAEPFTHLLFTDTGQHGEPGKKGDVIDARLAKAEFIAKQFDLPVIPIFTNLDTLFKCGFQQNHTLRNAACALLFGAQPVDFTYSSTYTNQAVVAHEDIAVADEKLLPLISTPRVRLRSDCSPLTRAAKLSELKHNGCLDRGVYVCTEKHIPAENCGYCFKCRRTCVMLDAIGAHEALNKSFSNVEYYKRRRRFLVGLAASARSNQADREAMDELIGLSGSKQIFVRVLSFCVNLVKFLAPQSLLWRLRHWSPLLFT